jgi:hypothetical protein
MGAVASRSSGRGSRTRALCACVVAACLAGALLTAALAGAGSVGSGPGGTQTRSGDGRFVPVPKVVPHAEGAYIDSRIRADVKWLAKHFRIYVVEGFAGRLPSGRLVGCPKCHVETSEHKIGLALDIVPYVAPPAPPNARQVHSPRYAARTQARCDKVWKGVSRLAKWAEPDQNRPNAPFRWVGYDGDEGHGCGHHLHLSWSHDDDFRKYRPSDWVETFR